MADVYAVFGTLLALGIAFPGMLVAWWLLFPTVVARASGCLDRSPWSCLGIGLGLAVAVVVLAEVCRKRLNNPAADQIFPGFTPGRAGFVR